MLELVYCLAVESLFGVCLGSFEACLRLQGAVGESTPVLRLDSIYFGSARFKAQTCRLGAVRLKAPGSIVRCIQHAGLG